MKKNFYIRTLSCAATAFAMAGAFTACSEAEILDSFEGGRGNGLAIAPVVTEATVVTRAASVEELKEKQLNTLDVFVEHVTGGTGDDTFLKKYHLTAINDEIGHQIQSLLADNWRLEGLRMGEKYNVYVAVNNTKTTEATAKVTSATALKALTYSEVEEGIAVVDETTNNISWPWTDQFANTPSGFIYKQYVDEADAEAVKVNGNLYGFTTEKEFMMDGVLKNWTPASNTLDQVFDVTLNRAAAKVVLNVKFDADFLKSLTQEKNDDGQWVDKPADEQISIINNPAWRFYNFAFGAPVFAPETQGAGVEVHNSATLLRHPYEFAGDDKHFQIITYTYPNKWAAADYATKAPSLVISVPYKKAGEAEPEYGYYRIPLVKSDVTAIERNHIYVINATIATRGSELHEDEDVIEDVEYAVLPWNDKSNSDAIDNKVEAVQHYYLKVNPKVYTLRGDGQQSVDINYLKAAGTSVKWQLYSFDTTTQTKGAAVEPTANNAVWGWYYDGDGDMKTSYSGMTHMGVTISQSNEGTSGSSGKITVTSTDLPNRAIKYMLLRVYLNEKQTLYEDVIIRHFPTDNIQSVKSLWSSRTSTGWWSYLNGGLEGSGYKTDYSAGNTSEASNLFQAKFYYNYNGYVYIYENDYYGWSRSSLTNNSKYVIQISSTSNQYVLGRPYLNGNKQSNDHVVSPAFMIASQLGATSNKNPRNNDIVSYGRAAANHCDTYKEVDSDGTEWTGWRLPTREEVGVILRYQHANYDTMDPVMTGRYYWTLEGAAVATGINSEDYQTWYPNWAVRYSDTSYDYKYGNGNCYIRCIRDMSASEIESLNGFEEIIDQYQNK